VQPSTDKASLTTVALSIVVILIILGTFKASNVSRGSAAAQCGPCDIFEATPRQSDGGIASE
jgi:hypothetical protein